MVSKALMQTLDERLTELSRKVDELHAAVSDAPHQLSLVDMILDAVTDLRGRVEEARVQARQAREAVERSTLDLASPAARLSQCQALIDDMARKFATEIHTSECIVALTDLGRERAEEWAGWSKLVRESLNGLQQPLSGVQWALGQCWQEIAAQAAVAISAQAALTGQRLGKGAPRQGVETMNLETVQLALSELARKWTEAEQALSKHHPGAKEICQTRHAAVKDLISRLTETPATALPDAIQVFKESCEACSHLHTLIGSLDRPARDECARLVNALRVSIGTFMQNVTYTFCIAGDGDGREELKAGLDNITAYPLLTSEVGAVTPSISPQLGAGVGGAALRRTVESAMTQVLGRLPRDPQSIMAALNRSFEITEDRGRTEVKWRASSYAGQTDLGGGVTGAQASLHTMCKVALEHALPLLDQLYPLGSCTDPQMVEAARAIVRSDLESVVAELGTEGGPLAPRVEELLGSLLGPLTGGQEPHLDMLSRMFGLTAGGVNTLEEEDDYTRYYSLRKYAELIRQAWNDFSGPQDYRDLGTGLVLLQRALSVVLDTVEEVETAMDSVFVGPAERQVASFATKQGPVSVQDPLKWARALVTVEAPGLIRDAGRQGATAIIPTAGQIRDLVHELIDQLKPSRLRRSMGSKVDLPPALRHPRVLNSLQDLERYLQQACDRAEDVANGAHDERKGPQPPIAKEMAR